MKTLIILFCLLFCTALVHADGRSYFSIQVLFETKSGEKIIGWVEYDITTDWNEIDSVKQEGYLKKHFMGKDCIDSTGYIDYYKHRIHYTLDFLDSLGQQIQYWSWTKLDWHNLAYKDIRRISVLQVEDVRKYWDKSGIVYIMSIENEISASDTIWMKRKPVQKFTFNGDACSFDLIIHERNSKTDALVKELKELELLLEKDPEKDEKILSRMQKIKGLKVIVLVPPCFC